MRLRRGGSNSGCWCDTQRARRVQTVAIVCDTWILSLVPCRTRSTSCAGEGERDDVRAGRERNARFSLPFAATARSAPGRGAGTSALATAGKRYAWGPALEPTTLRPVRWGTTVPEACRLCRTLRCGPVHKSAQPRVAYLVRCGQLQGPKSHGPSCSDDSGAFSGSHPPSTSRVVSCECSPRCCSFLPFGDDPGMNVNADLFDSLIDFGRQWARSQERIANDRDVVNRM
jgi:hypothetical protein